MPSPSNNNADPHPAALPPDPSATWFCKECHKSPNPSDQRRLKACARCRLAHYCDVTCQRRNFPNHKAPCKRLSTLQNNLRQSTESFESYVVAPSRTPCNLFEECRGHFYHIPHTREHCRKLAELGHELEAMAAQYQVAPLLDKSLAHRLELLRLNTDDDLGMCDLVPFTLLRLHRDDRCVAFIAHWLRRMNGLINPLPQHEMSRRGDWLYGNADRFDDVFTLTSTQPVDAPVTFLIALCIVKLRIIARGADDARPERVREQETIVERYFDAIHRRNPSLLPALINPAPLHSGPAPVLKQFGGPSEAYFTLLSCYELFVSVPGAVQRLIRRFGPSPEYESRMSVW